MKMQLQRHLATASRYDFDDVHLIAITTDEDEPEWLAGIPNAHHKSWPAIFTFLSDPVVYNNDVARFVGDQFLKYIRAIEARRNPGDDFILSTFTGIRFDEANPFSEGAARVALRTLMRDLRPALDDSQVLPGLLSASRQKRLTGAWDVVTFEFSRGDSFTEHPHLCVGIWDEGASIELILPNNARSQYWRHLINAISEELRDCLVQVLNNARPRRATLPKEPLVQLEILQRHYPTRTRYVVDGTIRFDIDALANNSGGIKALPSWIPAA